MNENRTKIKKQSWLTFLDGLDRSAKLNSNLRDADSDRK